MWKELTNLSNALLNVKFFSLSLQDIDYKWENNEPAPGRKAAAGYPQFPRVASASWLNPFAPPASRPA
ncbi:hypothetical protein ACLKA7_003837 [Drosophila subpalustris]